MCEHNRCLHYRHCREMQELASLVLVQLHQDYGLGYISAGLSMPFNIVSRPVLVRKHYRQLPYFTLEGAFPNRHVSPPPPTHLSQTTCFLLISMELLVSGLSFTFGSLPGRMPTNYGSRNQQSRGRMSRHSHTTPRLL